MKILLCRIVMVLCLLQAAACAADSPEDMPVFIPVEQGANGFPLPPQPVVPALIGLLALESGLNLVAHPYPWRRAQMMAEKGKGLLYGAAATPERRRIFRFTEPLGSVNQWLVSTQAAPLVFRHWDDLQGKVVSILSGARYGSEFERRRGRLFSVQQDSPTVGSRLAMLRAGRVDAVMIASYLDAPHLQAKLNCMFPGATGLVVAGRPVDMEPLMIAVPRSRALEGQLKVLNAAIERLSGSERLQRVRNLQAAGSPCR